MLIKWSVEPSVRITTTYIHSFMMLSTHTPYDGKSCSSKFNQLLLHYWILKYVTKYIYHQWRNLYWLKEKKFVLARSLQFNLLKIRREPREYVCILIGSLVTWIISPINPVVILVEFLIGKTTGRKYYEYILVEDDWSV